MYKLKHAHNGNPADTIVYDSRFHDYGCANDDSRYTGIEHTSVTLDPTGDYPFFTIPKHYLIKVVAEALTAP